MSKRITSSAYRDGSRGQSCTLRMTGCDGGGETTVFAHIADRHSGRSIKASDTSGCDACFNCHDRFDGRRPMIDSGQLITDAEWRFYALRALQETIERRVEQGILSLKLDEPSKSKTKRAKSGVKSSNLVQSRKIPQRKTNWAKRPFSKRAP